MFMLFIGLFSGVVIGLIAASLCAASANRDSGQECLDCQHEYQERITNLKDEVRAIEEQAKINRHAYLTCDGKLRAAQRHICVLMHQLDTAKNGYALEVVG
jgi:gas vesicle protein